MRNKKCVLLMSVVAFLLLFCSCRHSSGIADEGKDLILYSDGALRFELVYPDGASKRMEPSITSLQSAFERVLGEKPKAVPAGDAKEDGVKVLLLDAEALAAREDITDVPYFGYAIGVESGDLYIAAYSGSALTEAATAFGLRMEDFYKEGIMRIGGDYTLMKNGAAGFANLSVPHYTGTGRATVYDCYNDLQMVLLQNTDEASFLDYTKTLSEKGFALYAENDMNGNLFKTYRHSNGTVIHTYFVPHSKEVRIVAGKNVNLPTATAEPVKKVCDPFIYLLAAGSSVSGYDEGLGMILRQPSGEFIIVDGGYATDECAKEIYGVLREYAPDQKNIVVSAWYFTHGHSDHIGAFNKFATLYAANKNITVKSFLANFCLTAEQTEFFRTTRWTAALDNVKKYYPGATLYTPLTGQVYDFGDSSIEIFYTMEDYMPRVIPNEKDATASDWQKGDGNTQTMVARIKVSDTSLFVLGDTITIACDEMSTRYGSYMKSDFVQMAHHGLTDDAPYTNSPRRHNGTMQIYSLIHADYAILPCSEEAYQRRIVYTTNRYVEIRVKKVYVAGFADMNPGVIPIN